MPIVIKAVEQNDYEKWLANGGKAESTDLASTQK